MFGGVPGLVVCRTIVTVRALQIKSSKEGVYGSLPVLRNAKAKSCGAAS